MFSSPIDPMLEPSCVFISTGSHLGFGKLEGVYLTEQRQSKILRREGEKWVGSERRRQGMPNKISPQFRGEVRLARTILNYTEMSHRQLSLFILYFFYIAFSDIPESDFQLEFIVSFICLNLEVL